MEVPQQKELARKQCELERIIQRVVSRSEHVIIVIHQDLDGKLDTGLAANGNFDF